VGLFTLQPLPRVPKLFQPSVACPECRYANDEGFNFCQNCGYKRQTVSTSNFTLQRLKYPVDEETITARWNELIEVRKNTPYVRQKTALEKELGGFLSKLAPPKNVTSCVPEDLVKFLIWKDQGGRTIVHHKECPFLGQKEHTFCSCPSRLANGTVDALIGKLRAIFTKNGRSGEWDSRLIVGNPASALVMKEYLDNIRSEQLQARVTPKQAKPFLFAHLVALSRFILAKLRDHTLQPQR
jgi:hypothetical protein